VAVKEWPRSQWDMVDAPVSMPAPHHHIAPDLGIAVAPLDDASKAAGGVVVTSVAPGSDAADHGLAVGDIIERVQGAAVSTPDQVADALAATRAEKREFVLVLVQPKSGTKTSISWKTLRLADD
jgi:S1-C subfamily serine protease